MHYRVVIVVVATDAHDAAHTKFIDCRIHILSDPLDTRTCVA